MRQRTLLIIAGVIVAVLLYFVIDTHTDVHNLTDMVEELLAR